MTELQSLLADVTRAVASVSGHGDMEALPEGPALCMARAEARRTLRALERLRGAIGRARAEVAP